MQLSRIILVVEGLLKIIEHREQADNGTAIQEAITLLEELKEAPTDISGKNQ